MWHTAVLFVTEIEGYERLAVLRLIRAGQAVFFQFHVPVLRQGDQIGLGV
jgi:hypothetical protein